MDHILIPPVIHTTEVEDSKSYTSTMGRRQRLSAVSSSLETDPDRNVPKPNHEDSIRRNNNNKRIASIRVSTSSSNQGLLLAEDDIDGRGAPGKCDPLLLARPHQPVRCALDTCSSTDSAARPLSSRSNYENERLCASDDCLSSPRCKMAGVVIGNDLCKSPKRSVKYNQDASNRATEEVNNLLKELGVYLPEDQDDECD